MDPFSSWTRVMFAVCVSVCVGRCAESSGLLGTIDVDASEDVGGSEIPVFDSRTDADVAGASDVELDGAAEDAVDVMDALAPPADVDSADALDATDTSDLVDAVDPIDGEHDSTGESGDAADPADINDASPDAVSELGTPCRANVECASGDCVMLAAGDMAGLCSAVCDEDNVCREGFACAVLIIDGADAERWCLPADYCADGAALPEGYRVVDGVCEPVTCDEAPAAPANATQVSISSAQPGGEALYACNEGYVLTAGVLSRTCEATGAWSVSTALCTPVDCGALPELANGDVVLPEGTFRGAVATYSCTVGYVLTGSPTRTCLSSGLWSNVAPSCVPVDCGVPPTIANGSRSFESTTYRRLANYACNRGFALSGPATLSCSAEGRWGAAPTCNDVDECVRAGSACTAPNNACTNTAGSWQCSCEAGYIGTTVAGGDATCTLSPVGSGRFCLTNSQCPVNNWCSTVSGYRRCSPRLFGGAEHQMDFVFVPSGTYEQGTPGATNDERAYTSTISRDYFVSVTEVTQGQWKAATGGTNGSCFQSTTGTACTTANVNNSGPVDTVAWYSALAYANWLSVSQGLSACYTLTPSTCADAVSDWATGGTSCTAATFAGLTCTGYRLPTESEWERAARGNTTSTYFWGEATDTATVGLYAWFNENAGNRSQAVGRKQPNGYGLFDTSRNGWEWVWDAYTSYPSGSATDYTGAPTSSARVVRGGGWDLSALFLRSAYRGNFMGDPSNRRNNVGFRLARTAD